jgi:YVTN family beta-propeller protein
VANQDEATVSIIDLASRQLVETVDLAALGFGPNAKPHHVQVEPDGSFWYLTMIGAGKVVKFDRANRMVGSVALEVPGLLSLHLTRDLLVVGRSMSAVNPPRRIAVIRRSDMTLLDEPEVFFPRPHALVVDPRGDHVFVASLGVNQLASVPLDGGPAELVDLEGEPRSLTQFAHSPDGRWLALTAQSAAQVLVFEITDPAKPRLVRSIPMAKGPFEPVFSQDGRLLFVTNLDANKVSVVETAGWTVTSVIGGDAFSQPHGVALSPDGRYLFVSNRHQAGGAHDHEGRQPTGTGTVVAICIPTRAVASVVVVGDYAAGLAAPAPRLDSVTAAGCG